MIEFFRDTLSGIYYYIYVAVDLLLIFALVGYIGEQKEKELSQEEAAQINTQLANNQTTDNQVVNETTSQQQI